MTVDTVDGSGIRRSSKSWWASALSLVVCLGPSSDGLGAQAHIPALPAPPTEAEIALMHTPGEICARTGTLPDETAVDVRAPLVRYLLHELIAQRLENAQLTADLADAKAQRTEIEKAVREKEAALAAWIRGLHDELPQREAQFADATAAQASGARLLGEARAAEASARALRQLAAIRNRLKEQDHQSAVMRSVAEELRQRLGAAESELKHRDAENGRLVAELAALRMTTDSATVTAHVNTAAIEDQMDILPERPGHPAELLSATSVNVFPTVPHPKPLLREGEFEAWALVSDTADGGPRGPGEENGAIEDATWIQTGPHEVALKDWGPTTDTTLFSASGTREIPNMGSTAGLALTHILAPGERGPAGLDEAAARLADGLRATREEAILEHQERVFTVDVEKRAFASSGAGPVSLDPALDIRLLTAKSELVGDSKGRIRFFSDGSSTGGRIEIGLLGDQAAVNVRWSTGAVTLEP